MSKEKTNLIDRMSIYSGIAAILSVIILGLFSTSCASKSVDKDTLKKALRIVCAVACESRAQEKCECQKPIGDL